MSSRVVFKSLNDLKCPPRRTNWKQQNVKNSYRSFLSTLTSGYGEDNLIYFFSPLDPSVYICFYPEHN